MSTQKKIRSDSALGTLPEERQIEIAEYARAHSLVKTAAWLQADGLKTSYSSLQRWFASFVLRRQFRLAEQDALIFIELLRKRRPELSEPELQSWANEFFQVQAVKSGDAKTYLAIATAKHKAQMDKLNFEQRERAMQQEREKWLAAQNTKIEAGLDALFQEVKDNAEARALFEKFKSVVTGATP